MDSSIGASSRGRQEIDIQALLQEVGGLHLEDRRVKQAEEEKRRAHGRKNLLHAKRALRSRTKRWERVSKKLVSKEEFVSAKIDFLRDTTRIQKIALDNATELCLEPEHKALLRHSIHLSHLEIVSLISMLQESGTSSNAPLDLSALAQPDPLTQEPGSGDGDVREALDFDTLVEQKRLLEEMGETGMDDEDEEELGKMRWPRRVRALPPAEREAALAVSFLNEVQAQAREAHLEVVERVHGPDSEAAEASFQRLEEVQLGRKTLQDEQEERLQALRGQREEKRAEERRLEAEQEQRRQEAIQHALMAGAGGHRVGLDQSADLPPFQPSQDRNERNVLYDRDTRDAVLDPRELKQLQRRSRGYSNPHRDGPVQAPAPADDEVDYEPPQRALRPVPEPDWGEEEPQEANFYNSPHVRSGEPRQASPLGEPSRARSQTLPRA